MQLGNQLQFKIEKQELTHRVTGETITLSFSEAAILNELLQNQTKVKSKETLLKAGWSTRVVSDTSLLNCISTLRKKLTHYPEIEIKTIPRHGYLLNIKDTDKKLNFLSKITLWKAVFFVMLIVIPTLYLMLSMVISDKPHFKQSMLKVTLSNMHGTINAISSEQVNASTLQKHIDSQILPEPEYTLPFSTFYGFAHVEENSHSFAICPNYSYGQCPGNKLINLFGYKNEPTDQKLSEFMRTKIRMEQKSYNKLNISGLSSDNGEFIEQLYHGDAYFKLDNDFLARVDLRISLMPLGIGHGAFYFASCTTDENCATTPLKFTLHGKYVHTKEELFGKIVDKYTVKVNDSDLSNPNHLSKMAKKLYLEYRQIDITHPELIFYQVYSDKKTAVWILPISENLLVWTEQRTIKY